MGAILAPVDIGAMHDACPRLNAPTAIQLHAFAALSAFILGILKFVAPKGTLPHRAMGFAWLALMLVVALSSF